MPRRAPEKAAQRDIKRALVRLGFVVNDMSQPRASMMPVGLPDLYAQHPVWRVRLWVEVKAPKGRLSDAQALWMEIEQQAGGTVVVARSASDLIEPLRALGAPINV